MWEIILTSLGGLITALIIKLTDYKISKDNRKLDSLLNDMSLVVKTNSETTNQLHQIESKVDMTLDGLKKIKRYRLYHDLTKEISRGYTDISRFRELSVLYDSYAKLGGNGEIEVLFEKYKQLEIMKEEDHED